MIPCIIGNSWGCATNGCCIGCGQQEQFYNCADIGIYEHDEVHMQRFQPPQKKLSPTPIKQKVKSCEPSPVYQNVPGMKSWCQNSCPFCPKSHCVCQYI